MYYMVMQAYVRQRYIKCKMTRTVDVLHGDAGIFITLWARQRYITYIMTRSDWI